MYGGGGEAMYFGGQTRIEVASEAKLPDIVASTRCWCDGFDYYSNISGSCDRVVAESDWSVR